LAADPGSQVWLVVSAFVSEDQIAMPRTLRRLRPLAEAAFTRVVARRLVARALPPGRAVDLLPPVPLPADLQWASGWPGRWSTGTRLLAPVEAGLPGQRAPERPA
jgi:hypothetical protein